MFNQRTQDRDHDQSFLNLWPSQAALPDIRDIVRDLCQRQSPLYTLERFVALNPFDGWTDSTFADFAKRHVMDLGYDLLPDWAFFQEAYRNGEITESDMKWVLAGGSASELTSADLLKFLQNPPKTTGSKRIILPSETVTLAPDVRAQLDNAVAHFCAVHLDRTYAPWDRKDPHELLHEWLESAGHDLSWDLAGLGYVRRHLRTLAKSDPWTPLRLMMATWAPDPAHAFAFVRRLVEPLQGWLGYGRFLDRESGSDETVISEQIILARALVEWALWKELSVSTAPAATQSVDSLQGAEQDIACRELWLRAYESSKRRQLSASLRPSPGKGRASPAKYQFVFCIDPRSETMRRHLERQSDSIETLGFAGFFGIPLAARNEADEITDRCPYLLRASVYGEAPNSQASAMHHAPEIIGRHLNTAFSFVEATGLLLLPRLLLQSFGRKTLTIKRPKQSLLMRKDQSPLSVADRAAMVQGFLQHTGLKGRIAGHVFICGHGSSTPNNPFASALACGACGGHAGDVNAALACQLLNDREVRLHLRGSVWEIPDDTLFIPMLHETCSQTLHVLDDSWTGSERQQVSVWLKKAGKGAADERAAREKRQGEAAAESLRRATDWSEIRPEWGLANNLYFIAAPREWTAPLDLRGRAFLHNYDPAADPEAQTLELILTAPLIVAYGINMQYYTSRVDPLRFGSGNKTLHNPVGSFGVLEGTSYCLRSGLPLQSLHDGQVFQHEPLRLQAFIHSSSEAVDRILQKHRSVARLIEGGWLSLMVIDDKGRVRQREAHGMWRELRAGSGELTE